MNLKYNLKRKYGQKTKGSNEAKINNEIITKPMYLVFRANHQTFCITY